MYRLTADELDSICEAGNYKTLDLALFSVCIGIAVTAAVTLATVDLTPNVQRTFISVSVITCVLTVWFGIRAIIAWGHTKRTLKKLKGEP